MEPRLIQHTRTAVYMCTINTSITLYAITCAHTLRPPHTAVEFCLLYSYCCGFERYLQRYSQRPASTAVGYSIFTHIYGVKSTVTPR